MSDQLIEADYFVVGTGASAMAFVDTLLTDTVRAGTGTMHTLSSGFTGRQPYTG
jgi:hypothetical protein